MSVAVQSDRQCNVFSALDTLPAFHPGFCQDCAAGIKILHCGPLNIPWMHDSACLLASHQYVIVRLQLTVRRSEQEVRVTFWFLAFIKEA